jgi:plasmid maintenance system antidote protein VapI
MKSGLRISNHPITNNPMTTYQPTPHQLLADLLQHRNLSRYEAAKKIGVSYNWLCQILHGRQPLNATFVMRLQNKFGVTDEQVQRIAQSVEQSA